jgi:hypothetical protein
LPSPPVSFISRDYSCSTSRPLAWTRKRGAISGSKFISWRRAA